MMAWPFPGSRRIEALEQALAGVPEAIAMLREQVAIAVARSDATVAAVEALGTRIDLAERAAEDGAAATGERLARLEAAVERDAAALRDADISLLRLDRQFEAQARESRTLAEAVMHRIAPLPPV